MASNHDYKEGVRESPTVAVLYCYIKKKKKNQAESRSVIDRERGRVNYKGSHE